MKDVKILSPMVDEMLKWLDERYQIVTDKIAKRSKKSQDYPPTSLVMMVAEKDVVEAIEKHREDRDTFATIINRVYRVQGEHYFRICKDENDKHYLQCVNLNKNRSRSEQTD